MTERQAGPCSCKNTKHKGVNKHIAKMRNIVKQQTLSFEHNYPNVLKSIEKIFNEYINDVSGMVIINKHKYIYDKICVIPYTHRAHPEYLRKIKKKIRHLKKIQTRGVFITLTTDPKKCLSYYDMHRNMSNAWKKLHAYINKKIGKFEYIKVYELTKSGLIHAHIVILDKKFVIEKQKLTELTKKYGIGEVNYITYFERGRSVYNYIMKYITKTIDIDTNIDLTEAKYMNKYNSEIPIKLCALATALHMRVFSLSSSLQLHDHRKDHPLYELAIIFIDGSMIKEYAYFHQLYKLIEHYNAIKKVKEVKRRLIPKMPIYEYAGVYPDKRVGYGILYIPLVTYLYS